MSSLSSSCLLVGCPEDLDGRPEDLDGRPEDLDGRLEDLDGRPEDLDLDGCPEDLDWLPAERQRMTGVRYCEDSRSLLEEKHLSNKALASQ